VDGSPRGLGCPRIGRGSCPLPITPPSKSRATDPNVGLWTASPSPPTRHPVAVRTPATKRAETIVHLLTGLRPWRSRAWYPIAARLVATTRSQTKCQRGEIPGTSLAAMAIAPTSPARLVYERRLVFMLPFIRRRRLAATVPTEILDCPRYPSTGFALDRYCLP